MSKVANSEFGTELRSALSFPIFLTSRNLNPFVQLI